MNGFHKDNLNLFGTGHSIKHLHRKFDNLVPTCIYLTETVQETYLQNMNGDIYCWFYLLALV